MKTVTPTSLEAVFLLLAVFFLGAGPAGAQTKLLSFGLAQPTSAADPSAPGFSAGPSSDAQVRATNDCVIMPRALVDVSSAVLGQLEEMNVELSERVRKGQVIARLESKVERASLALAQGWFSIRSEIRIEAATKALDRRRQDRIARLFASQAVALEEKERVETDAALAGLRLQLAEEKRWIRKLDATKAEAVLERRTVRSPIDGVVVERFRAAGEYVENQPIVRIAQLDPLEVETILPMAQFGRIEVGMVAEVVPEHAPGDTYRAVVRVVDRMGDAASGTFGVRLALPNPDRAIPAGLRCTLAFLPGETLPRPGAGTHVEDARPAEIPASETPPPVRKLDAQSTEAELPRAVQPRPAHPAAGQPRVEPPALAVPGGRLEARLGKAAAVPLAAKMKQPPGRPHATAGAGPNDATPYPAAGASSCAVVGPLNDRNTAERVSERLHTAGHTTRAYTAPTPVPVGYIVVTPRQTDRNAAKTLARRIGAAGVKHRVVVSSGRYANRVSLGVFTRHRYAQGRLAEVQANGVAAEVMARTRAGKRWFVHLRHAGPPSAVAQAADWPGDWPLEITVCETAVLASGEATPPGTAPLLAGPAL